MSVVQVRVLAACVLAASVLVARPAAAQPTSLAESDGAVRALLEVEEAEQEAWLYSYRELNESYVWRNRGTPQLENAIVVALGSRDASDMALEQVPSGFAVAGVRAELEANVLTWEGLIARTTHDARTASLSELFEGMRETPFAPTLERVADALRDGQLVVSPAVAAAFRRALATKRIRGCLLGVQAEIGRTVSDLSTTESELRELLRERDTGSRTLARTMRAQAAVVGRELGRLRLARTTMLRALLARRSGASVERVIAGLRRVRDTDELRALERDLREATATPGA